MVLGWPVVGIWSDPNYDALGGLVSLGGVKFDAQTWVLNRK